MHAYYQLPLGDYGGPTRTMPLALPSPAINAGGPLAALNNNSIGVAGSTFSVADAAVISSTPGTFILQVDSEEILASHSPSSGFFTVLQHGYKVVPGA